MSTVQQKLEPIFTPRFLKFCTVGFSGVAVNLGFLMIFSDMLRLHVNIASALAIEISIISNYIINDIWTFRDRRSGRGLSMNRALRFNAVSLFGAGIQWAVFVALNVVWLILFHDPEIVRNYFDIDSVSPIAMITTPILDPPDVGNWKYLSQVVGIGVATFWNFLVNFYWTWSQSAGAGDENDTDQ